MVVFWILAACMVLAALAIVLVPLLRTRDSASGPSEHEATLEVLRGQRGEIEADIAAGTLPAEARDEVLAELVERAGHDLPPAEAATPKRGAAIPPARPWATAAVVAIALPALAFGLYAAIGTPAATDPRMLQAAASGASHEKELIGMVESLARKVRERPDDARGWDLLARSMMQIGRYPEAVEAYEQLARIMPGEAQVYADWADALGMAQGRSLRGRPRELAEKALSLDPQHAKALALAGTAAMDASDYRAAMGYWQRLAAVVPPGSEDAAQVSAVMEEVRQRSGGTVAIPATRVAKAPSSSEVAKAPSSSEKAAASGSGISGSVTLAPAVADKMKGGEQLFVFARAEGGPRVPLAVVKVPARELPYQFALDDSQAMAPGMNISSAQAVRIEARISRSGEAKAQPGDLVGTSEVVRPGARGVKVVVDRVLVDKGAP
jgi:cytochrome c-type biogenesis protein CcmH